MAYLKVENVRITGISAGVPKHAEGSVSILISMVLKTSYKLLVSRRNVMMND